MNFPIPVDEEERLRILESYGLLDTPTEEAFDRITRFAARRFRVPICLVSLIDRNRQFFKSCFGLGERETSREHAFCAHTILHPGHPLIVEDAENDARFVNNALVVGPPYIRFYAGYPILAQQGSALGSLCIIDRKPRSLDPADIDDLRDLAAMVESEIHLHERRQAAENAQRNYRQLHQTVSQSIEHLRANLVWMIPHELATPLNGVLGFADLLQRSWRDLRPDHAEELLHGLQDAALRMERGVRNICLLSNLEIAAGDPLARQKLGRQAEPCAHLALQDIATRQAKAHHRADDLRLDLGPGRIDAFADFFAKAAEELIDNAFKFSQPGQSVRVRGLADRERYELSVTDQGRGMTQSQIQAIEAFMQFDRDRFEQQGLGLGLALVTRVAALAGAEFRLASKPEEGLSAWLRFPSSPNS